MQDKSKKIKDKRNEGFLSFVFYPLSSREGFTLIELLVVISVISLLSSVVLTNVNSARAKARDANRTASIRQVQTALEFYYDTNGRYPTSADEPFSGSLSSALVPTYMPVIPSDPIGTYRYYTGSQNPAQFYAIQIPYGKRTVCYVCGGTPCGPDIAWWGLNICQ